MFGKACIDLQAVALVLEQSLETVQDSNSSIWRSQLNFPWGSHSQRHRDGPAESQFRDFSALGMNSLPGHWQWCSLLDIAAPQKWVCYQNDFSFFLLFFSFSPPPLKYCICIPICALLPQIHTTGSLCSAILGFFQPVSILHWQMDF